MIKAVLFDVGGTLHTVTNNEGLRTAFARRLIDRLAVYGIVIPEEPETFGQKLHENAEAYKHETELSLVELPAVHIWNEYYLREYEIGEERLAPIAEELSFLYDYERVTNKRRPRLYETIAELARMGMRQGIISNIISTSFVPHILNEYDIAKFMELIVMSSEAGCRKPSAEIFNIALERLHMKPSEMAYVGDTISRDVLGARNAQIGMIIKIDNPAIAHRDAAFRENAPRADCYIKELYEIPDIIRAFNNNERRESK